MTILYPGDMDAFAGLTPEEAIDKILADNGWEPVPYPWGVTLDAAEGASYEWSDPDEPLEAEFRVVSEESEGPAPDPVMLGVDIALPGGLVVLVVRHPDGTMTVIQDETL